MKYMAALLVVEDIERSKRFYTEVMGQTVMMDLGANVDFGGFALQSKESWADFIAKAPSEIRFGGNQGELYFEVEEFEREADRLKAAGVELVRDVVEYPWGQRVLRVYDPDRHIVEVGESMAVVCLRFLRQGMSVEEVSSRTMFPEHVVRAIAEGKNPAE